MKAKNETKKLTRVLTMCGLATATVAMSWSCTGAGASTESFERSDYYTRGIGHYPGNPSEDFSPELKPDDTYRNIALFRAAYQSSSHDYNLVAQLVTDGVITEKEPQYLDLITPDGKKPRREREWMIDHGPYSRNVTVGEDTYFQFSLNNYSKKADQIYMRGSVAYNADKANKGYEIICQGSNDERSAGKGFFIQNAL